MAASSFERALALVLRHEGGYVDHPRDPGGATNLGVTLATLSHARGRPATKADVRELTRAEAAGIYRRSYWDAVQGDDLPAGIDLLLFDLAVNSGPARAVRILQRALGVAEDGVAGPRTRAALARADPKAVIAAVTRERLLFLQRLPTWPTFGRGWRRRAQAIEQEAHALQASAGLQAGAARAAVSKPQHRKGHTMTERKPIFMSKTVWANIIGLACTALAMIGVDTGGVDTDGFAEAAAQLVAAASFIASTVFRITASKQLAG
jgi:lysozyme family protein